MAMTMSEEKLKIWIGFTKFLLGTFALGLVTTLINSAIQTREVELKEQEQVGQFLQHALKEDVGIRRRFAQYFSTVTRSDKLREGWVRYSAMVDQEYQDTREEKEKLKKQAAATGIDAKEREKLNSRIKLLEQALRPSSSASRKTEINNVPESEVESVMNSFQNEGASVSVTKQADGTFTITAEFPRAQALF
jgi:hypothetical protein